MRWTRRNLTKVLPSVGGRVLALLLCLCLSLFSCLPANATTGYWVLNSNSGYLGLENAGNKNITFTNNSYGVVSFTNNNVADSVWGMFFVAPNATTTSVTSNDDFFVTFAMVWSNPNALSLGHESMAKSCFVSNSQYMAIDDCQVAIDTGYNWTGDSRYTEAYIYSIHGHFLQSFGWLPSLNLRFKSAGLIATPSSAINVYITAPVINIYENREVAADQLVAQRAGEIRQDLARMHATLNDIAQNSSNAAVVQQQQQTNQKLDTVNTNLQNLQQATEEQTEQQQEQYEAEKEEEAEREEQANDDSEAMASAFSFSLLNPFSNIINLFTNGGSCVSIPNFARLVGSNESQFCPWFPAWVRNMLTPVIALVSSFFLFRYIWRWLGSDSESEVSLG